MTAKQAQDSTQNGLAATVLRWLIAGLSLLALMTVVPILARIF